MHTGAEIPHVGPETSLTDGMLEMSGKGLGMTGICDGNGKLLGVFTDGDLRRTLDHGVDVRSATMQQVMTAGARTVAPDMLAAEAVHIIEKHKINALLVVDEAGTLVGALNIHDLFRAGVM